MLAIGLERIWGRQFASVSIPGMFKKDVCPGRSSITPPEISTPVDSGQDTEPLPCCDIPAPPPTPMPVLVASASANRRLKKMSRLKEVRKKRKLMVIDDDATIPGECVLLSRTTRTTSNREYGSESTAVITQTFSLDDSTGRSASARCSNHLQPPRPFACPSPVVNNEEKASVSNDLFLYPSDSE